MATEYDPRDVVLSNLATALYDALYLLERAQSLHGPVATAQKMQELQRVLDSAEPLAVQAVSEMRLCEASRVVLQPDRLYRFTVSPNCKACNGEAH